ncbi:MAG: DUF2721 domain-containing protein [Nitrosomonas sp.]|nr:MAG: DUF2721 domain-containing protein [Nitrosomonas sp.]
MQTTPDDIADVARAIQLALAPVFLLTGIAGLLNVMAGRLARIIDRSRVLTEHQEFEVWLKLDSVVFELQSLERRRHFNSVAITACTIAALLLCMVVVALFFEVMFKAPLSWLIGALFTTSTLALVIGLAYFLREVHLATQIRITAHRTK